MVCIYSLLLHFLCTLSCFLVAFVHLAVDFVCLAIIYSLCTLSSISYSIVCTLIYNKNAVSLSNTHSHGLHGFVFLRRIVANSSLMRLGLLHLSALYGWAIRNGPL